MVSICNSSSMSFQEPAPVMRNIPEIFQIFHNVQFNSIQHKKYKKELVKIFHKIDEIAFRISYKNALEYVFRFEKANGNVDRVLQFAAMFCAALKEEEEFLDFVFDVILRCMEVQGHAVRHRACQLLALVLGALGDDASLNDDIWDKILSTQLTRLQDVRGAVRCRAVVALQRLQIPCDEKDPVTQAYTFHMRCDPSAAVRRAVVLTIAKSTRNLLHVLERLCDVDESVRKAAFLYISSINVTQLKVRQRVHVLKVGLTERSARVRRVVETTLLPQWLGSYHGSVLDLLAAVRLDNVQGAKDSAVVAGALLQALFKQQKMAELLEWLPIDRQLKLIPAEMLTKESAWYWRHLVKHMHSTQDTEHLEEVLPELVIYTSYVRALVESPCPSLLEQPVEYSRRQYVLQELISIFLVYDMADEVGRTALQSLLYDTLTGDHGPLDADIITATVRSIEVVIPDVKKRIEFVAGIISEIHEPHNTIIPSPVKPVESTETKIKRAELRVALNEAQEEQEEAVHAQNFVLAATCKQKVDAISRKLTELNAQLSEMTAVQPIIEQAKEKRNDPETLSKCLMILNALLDTAEITTLTPVLRSLFQNFEVQIYQDVDIRENALQTVALYSMLDKEFAVQQKPYFFSQFMNNENEQVFLTALKCVVDIICVHGVKMFNIDPDPEEGDEEEDQESSANKTRKSQGRDKSKLKNRSKAAEDSDAQRMSASTKLLQLYRYHRVERQKKLPYYQCRSAEEVFEKSVKPEQPPAHDTIIEVFIRLMNSECAAYRAVVAEGLCRLLSIGRISSSSLVSRLLLLWFNPATEEEDGLKQILGTFFPLFASGTEGASEQLEGCVLPTLLTLAGAPHDSPLAEVDHEAVLRFMLGLTLPTQAPGALNVHANLGVQVLSALERDAGDAAPLLCRALALLTPPRSAALCRDLLASVERVLDLITDKGSYRNVAKFQAKLQITLDSFEQRPSEGHTALETIAEHAEDDNAAMPRESVKCTDRGESTPNREAPAASSSSPDSLEVEIESVPSPSNADDEESQQQSSESSSPPSKMKRITAFDVAKRAITKTPRNARSKKSNHVATSDALPGKKAAELSTPVRSGRKKRSSNDDDDDVVSTPATSVRKSSRKAAAAKTAAPTKPAARGLQKQLEDVAVEEKATKGAKRKGAASDAAVKPKPAPKKPAARKAPSSRVSTRSSTSSRNSSQSDIQESDDSDDETILHTICHDAPQEVSLLQQLDTDSESDSDESNNRTSNKQRGLPNVTVPGSSDSSDIFDSDDSDTIPVSQNAIIRKRK